jgi:xanthine dehydrogenase YagS FAD-binding subunit
MNIVPAVRYAGRVIRPFTFVRPSAADEAVRAVAGDLEAVFLAGGTNLVDHLRLGVARPAVLDVPVPS